MITTLAFKVDFGCNGAIVGICKQISPCPILKHFPAKLDTKAATIRISALHALAYCPRLFYLEEVEELYTHDAAVFAGRRLHAELEKQEDEDWEELFLTSEELGIRGRVDALRTRDGGTIPYEHKRGRCYRDEDKQPQAWESDKLQILAQEDSILFVRLSDRCLQDIPKYNRPGEWENTNKPFLIV